MGKISDMSNYEQLVVYDGILGIRGAISSARDAISSLNEAGDEAKTKILEAKDYDKQESTSTTVTNSDDGKYEITHHYRFRVEDGGATANIEAILSQYSELESSFEELLSGIENVESDAEIMDGFCAALTAVYAECETQEERAALFRRYFRTDENGNTCIATDEYRAQNGQYVRVSDDFEGYWTDDSLEFSYDERTGSILMTQGGVGMGWITPTVASGAAAGVLNVAATDNINLDGIEGARYTRTGSGNLAIDYDNEQRADNMYRTTIITDENDETAYINYFRDRDDNKERTYHYRDGTYETYDQNGNIIASTRTDNTSGSGNGASNNSGSSSNSSGSSSNSSGSSSNSSGSSSNSSGSSSNSSGSSSNNSGSSSNSSGSLTTSDIIAQLPDDWSGYVIDDESGTVYYCRDNGMGETVYYMHQVGRDKPTLLDSSFGSAVYVNYGQTYGVHENN